MNTGKQENSARWYGIIYPLIVCLCILLGRCILPGLLIDFYDTTGYHANVMLTTETSSGGTAHGFQIDPWDTTDFRLRSDGQCGWVVRLVENERQIFADSGVVYIRDIEGKRPSCLIRDEAVDSFEIEWDVE